MASGADLAELNLLCTAAAMPVATPVVAPPASAARLLHRAVTTDATATTRYVCFHFGFAPRSGTRYNQDNVSFTEQGAKAMTTSTVNLVVKVPLALRRQAKAAAVIRGETVSDVVRQALAEYVARVEEEDDIRFADAVLQRIAEGAPTYDMAEVWEELDRMEEAGELPG
jgi:predicted DNA-binding protein